MCLKSSKEETLKNFMEEFFDFNEMVQIGFFKKEWKNKYNKQAQKVCEFFGYSTVYEYGSIEIDCHISDGSKTPFITSITNIYK